MSVAPNKTIISSWLLTRRNLDVDHCATITVLIICKLIDKSAHCITGYADNVYTYKIGNNNKQKIITRKSCNYVYLHFCFCLQTPQNIV